MISYEEYKRLLAAGQKYVTQAQAADPEWAAFNQHAASLSAENMGELGASPTKDYWTEYLGTLTPDQAAGFQQHMADSSSWTDKVGSVLKYAIPAAVGGAGLAATGVLGATAQGAVGGASLGATEVGIGGLAGASAAEQTAINAALAGQTAGGATAATGSAASWAPTLFDTGAGQLFGSQAAIDTAASGALGTDVLSAFGANSILPAEMGFGEGMTLSKLASTSGLSLADAAAKVAQTAATTPAGKSLMDTIASKFKTPDTLLDWGNLLLTAGGIGSTIAAMTSDGGEIGKADPRLVEAQLRSMGYQDAAIQSILQTAAAQKASNDKLIPLQEEALAMSQAAGKTAYGQSQEDRQWLLGRRDELTGVQDSMIADAKRFNAEGEGERRANAYQADVTQSFDNVKAAEDRRLAGMGVMPGSGRYAEVASGTRANEQARALAGAANQGRYDARQEGRALNSNVQSMLAGYPSAATNTAQLGAQIGTNQLYGANAGAAGINSTYNAQTGAQQAASGVAAQMGGNATSMYGAQTSRDNAKAASENAANENLYGGIGALLGGATKWWNTKGP